MTSFSVRPSAILRASLRHHRADLLLELADAGLTRVMTRNQGDTLMRELNQLGVDAILLRLPRK